MSSSVAQALGVGDINLRSALNQPLDAEIELLQTRDLSSQEILSALASPDEFGRAGIERDFFLTDLVFTPIVRSDGRSVIRVTSTRPVREPFLNFLMEVRWPSGRVLREFTLLLDPPLYDPSPVFTQPTAPVRQAPAAPAVQRPAPTAASAPSAARPAARPSQTASALSGEYRTSRTDTLWEIALRSRPQGASVHQTMLAIQDLNPGAFIDNNINRMRAEQTLTLPDASQAASRNQADAVNQVAAQNAAWRSGREAAPAQRQLDARQQQTAAAAPATAPTGDSLRLVAGSEEQGDGVSDSRSTDDTGQLRDQLDRTKEQLDSVEREKAEADGRLAEMQAQMDTLQRLLELKDAQLAALQTVAGTELPEAVPESDSAEDVAAALAAADEQDMALVDEAGAPSGELAAPADSLVDSTTETEQLVGSELPITSEQPETAAVEPTAPVVEAQPAPVVEEQPEPAPQALLQRMMQNQTFMLAGGAVILLLVLLLLMALARRNARREAEMADNFIARAAQGREKAEVDDSDEFNVALAGFEEDADSELDIARDPLTEADALIAYGKLAEASDVLHRGIEQEPERVDLRLKLMEVDALLDNADGYVAQEAELRAMNNAGSYQIQALNARFPAMAAALAASTAPTDVSGLDDLDDAFLAETPGASSTAEVEEEAITDFDFSGFESDSPAADQAQLAEDEGLDLDFDLDESLAEDLADPGAPVAEKKVEETEFDLEFGLEEPTTAAQDDSSEFTLDEDFDLSLTDDLPADDSLIDEMDKLDAGTPGAVEETSFELSEDDLKDFEAELDASEPSADLDLTGFDSPAADEELEFETVSTEPVKPLGDESGDDDEFDFLSGTDECATKLDLARAYIDMGDQEGARDILAEVLDEGSEQQKQEAQEMMGQLD
ncbi:MAG: FimV/HubP family polar landmark protein [Pseudomonas sp.]